MCKLVQVDWPNQSSHSRNFILSRRVAAILVKELQSEIYLLVCTMYEVGVPVWFSFSILKKGLGYTYILAAAFPGPSVEN